MYVTRRFWMSPLNVVKLVRYASGFAVSASLGWLWTADCRVFDYQLYLFGVYYGRFHLLFYNNPLSLALSIYILSQIPGFVFFYLY